MTPTNIGQAIHDLRTAKGITQEQLAEVIGCPRSAISLIEQGQRNMSFVETVLAVQYILKHATDETRTQKLLHELVEMDAWKLLPNLSEDSKDYLEQLYYMFLPEPNE